VKFWLAIAVGSGLTVAGLWFTSIPLGIPGEWTWERPAVEADLFWNLTGGVVAVALFVAFVGQGWHRLEGFSGRQPRREEVAAWLFGLVIASFVWLWVVEEVSPVENRLGKSPFVLYYTSSSGYFTRARFEEPRADRLLAGYEDLMLQGDVLHTGTHPPGLFLAFQGLIALCESSPALSAMLDATQASSFVEACDVISGNNLRRPEPRPLVPLDRRTLWLATLLVMVSAALTVIPLYGLLRRTCSVQTAWFGAALWPAMPAVAVFIPKSDAMFPLIGAAILWLWLNAWDRRSLTLAVLAGAFTWCGLLCSLAFLPVLLLASLLTLGTDLVGTSTGPDAQLPGVPAPRIGWRGWLCLLAAAVGFALPTLLLHAFASVNLLNVWWLNFRNHAGFYQQYPRSYWKWLLVNPLELSCAAGWPVTLLAVGACYSVVTRFGRRHEPILQTRIVTVVTSVMIVWGLLWLTGKNSGEAARLWILFLPWLIWLATVEFDTRMTQISGSKRRQRFAVILLAIQFAVCLLTIARVSGFHLEAT
jgi:hypothetical protein